MAVHAPIKQTSAVEAVVTRLRAAILTGAMKPGERVKVAELKEDFGVSHIPIREALRLLETEGLVTSIAQRGSVVAEVGLDDLKGIWDLRCIIEGEVSRRACSGATDADVGAVLRAHERFVASADDDEYWRRHRDFHWALLAPAASDWTERMMNQLWDGSQRYVRLFEQHFEVDTERLASEHKVLADAFAARDGDLLADRMVEHITAMYERVKSGYIRIRELQSERDAAITRERAEGA